MRIAMFFLLVIVIAGYSFDEFMDIEHESSRWLVTDSTDTRWDFLKIFAFDNHLEGRNNFRFGPYWAEKNGWEMTVEDFYGESDLYLDFGCGTYTDKAGKKELVSARFYSIVKNQEHELVLKITKGWGMEMKSNPRIVKNIFANCVLWMASGDYGRTYVYPVGTHEEPPFHNICR